MYKISIQYTNPFKRYRTETKSVTYGTDGTEVRTDSGDTICPSIENGRGIKKIFTSKNWKFSDKKKSDIFHISA